jgi:hypothetical protein
MCILYLRFHVEVQLAGVVVATLHHLATASPVLGQHACRFCRLAGGAWGDVRDL